MRSLRIVTFSEKPYFHIFEIVSRIMLGGLLVWFADGTKFPVVFKVVGGVFVFAGVMLIIAGERRHREFAVRSATFTNIFRPAGVCGVIFGSFAIYAALATG